MHRAHRIAQLARDGIAHVRSFPYLEHAATVRMMTSLTSRRGGDLVRDYPQSKVVRHTDLFEGRCLRRSHSYRPYSSGNLPEHTVVGMPNLSPTMESGTIISWLKKEGDKIEEGDALAEIETDKSTMVADSSYSGYLAKILIPAGTKDIPISKPMYVLVEKKEDVAAFKNYDGASAAPTAKPKEAAPASQPVSPLSAPQATAPQAAPQAPQTDSAAPSKEERVFSSPYAKKIAAEKGIDLNTLSGSGPGGRVVAKDVEQAPKSQPVAPPAPLTTTILPPTSKYTDIQLSSMRKTIAKRLAESKQTIPHYYLNVEILMDNLLELRTELNDIVAKDKMKLSVNDFVIKAAALACKKVPAANSAWMDTFIREFNSVDVCVAVATDGGLITPIVREAEKKGLATINSDVVLLASKAREGKLQPHEFQGGTFTISNLGMYGVKSFTAIINPPQSCILAVGSTQKKPVVDEDRKEGFRIASVMSVTLSCDHRVVDGAVGAQWLAEFRQLLEKPNRMLL